MFTIFDNSGRQVSYTEVNLDKNNFSNQPYLKAIAIILFAIALISLGIFVFNNQKKFVY